jgi:hypothetical protein
VNDHLGTAMRPPSEPPEPPEDDAPDDEPDEDEPPFDCV